MNFIRLLLALLIASNCASATATATATTKVTSVTHAITTSVTRATYTTVTAATFAAHAPCATPFVYPIPADADFGYDQVPSTADTIKFYLMTFWGRLSEPILEFKEKLQHILADFMTDKQPAKETLTLRKWLDQSLAEQKLRDDAAAAKKQLIETQESRPFRPRDLTVVEPPMSFANITRPITDFHSLTKKTLPVTDLPTLTKITLPVTDFPSEADLPAVSSIDTENHSNVARYLPCDLLSLLAHVGLALCNELAKLSWTQFLMLFWTKLLAALERLMPRRMIEQLQSISWGCLYDLKLSLSTWAATSIIHDKFFTTKDMVCRLLNTIKAATVRFPIKVLDIMISKLLNWFDIDLAPLRATVQLLFNGRPNALRIITTTSPSVVEQLQTYVEKHPPSAESRPKAPFEAGPPEPRNEPLRLELPQSHSDDTSSDELIQHGSTALLPILEPIHEQLITEPPVGDIADAEQDSQLLEPMANDENRIYRWSYIRLAEILTLIATFPVYAPEPSNSFLGKVAFIRAHKSTIESQAAGLAYIRKMVGLVKQGVEDLIVEADFPVSRRLSGLGRSLEKLEAAFVKGLDIKLLTKNVEFIDNRYREGDLVWLKHWDKVSRTSRHLKTYLVKRQEYTRKFLQEVRELHGIYNDARERVMSTSNAQASL